MFAVVVLTLEFPVSGGVVGSSNIRIQQPFQFLFDDGYVLLVCELIVFIYAMNEFIIFHIREFYTSWKLTGSWNKYITEVGVIYDLSLAIMFITVLVLRVLVHVKTTHINLDAAPTEYVDMIPTANLLEDSTQMISVALFFCWLRTIKYLRILPRIGPRVQSILNTLRYLPVLILSVVFILVILCYTIAFHLLFGAQSELFSDFATSL